MRQLYNLRSEDNQQLQEWIQRKQHKYTGPNPQNGMLQMMVLNVVRDIAKCLHDKQLCKMLTRHTVILFANVSNKKQLVIFPVG